MKRPLALTGITYMLVLAVVFYFPNNYIKIVICILAFLLSLFAIIFSKKKIAVLLTISITSVLACFFSFLYTNNIYNPIIKNYSEKTSVVTAEICEEPHPYYEKYLYILNLKSIDNYDVDLKLKLISKNKISADEFDLINCKLEIKKETDTIKISKKFFLYATTDENFKYSVTKNNKKPLYYYFIKFSENLKNNFDNNLPEECASICKAILLGDKYSLQNDIRTAFNNTGVTFLIVVSGLHLMIVVGFSLFFVKIIIKNKTVHFLVILTSVFSFISITGFPSSAIRAGIMTSIVYFGKICYRDGDSLNSLGLSAIILTLTNPFAIGDIGMLLSFSATCGIIVWCKPIEKYMIKFAKTKNKFLFKFEKYFITAFAVSLSANLWVIPFSILNFGNISPYTILLSMILSPFVSILLIFVILYSILCFIPFNFIYTINSILNFLIEIASRVIVETIKLFTKLPFCSINTNKFYFYSWIIFTIILVLIGFLISAKATYIKCSIIFSITFFISVFSFSELYYSSFVSLNIYNTNGGLLAYVENGNNKSVVSCGGYKKEYEIKNKISQKANRFDYLILTSDKKTYSNYIDCLVENFDFSNVLLYDNLSNNTIYSIYLNEKTIDKIINIDGYCFQYIYTPTNSVLIVNSYGDITKLPCEYKTADYLVANRLPKNYKELNCKNIFITTTNKKTIQLAQASFENVFVVEDFENIKIG